MRKTAFLFASLILPVLLFSQTGVAPTITPAPIAPVSVMRGKQASFEFNFRVPRGFHINSNQPRDEYLIPTTLKLDAPNDIVIGKITYPDGSDMAFDFSPNQKINVYAGDVTITGMVRAMETAPFGTSRVHGMLTYQACDNAACYPPKRVPVEFDVRVVKPAGRPRRPPAQSPHAR